MWIKAKNGNVFEISDETIVEGLVAQGHKAFDDQASAKKAKVDAEPED